MVSNANIGPIVGVVTVGLVALVGGAFVYASHSDEESVPANAKPLMPSAYGGRGRTRRHRRSSRDTRKRRQ
jgi:hypothetical protein